TLPQFPGMVVAQEKIIVVKLYGVDAVGFLEMSQNCGGAGRRLDLLPAAVHRNDAAEIAPERTPYAGVVHGGARPEEGGEDVFRNLQPVIGWPGKFLGGT